MQDDIAFWSKILKPGMSILCLVIFWTWESYLPLCIDRSHRLRHAGRNLLIALINTLLLALLFGAVTVQVAHWTTEQQFGLLNWQPLPVPVRIMLAVLFLDGWMYVWHRLNHRIPLLWRFHRMHHSDAEMDVTTATRFHVGEHLISASLRMGLIPLLGISIREVLVYETLVVLCTMFHHANISLGKFDRPLRCVIVTPRMHQIHHSQQQSETDSNYSVLFSFWDRLARTYCMRHGTENVDLGLKEFREDKWQTLFGMIKTPFLSAESTEEKS